MINSTEITSVKTLSIFDISGRLILSKEDISLPTILDVNALDAGIYMLNINTRNRELITKKVLIP